MSCGVADLTYYIPTRHLGAVPGDADPPGQALLTHLDQRCERSPVSRGQFELMQVSDGVELEQVELLDVHPLQDALDVTGSEPRLGTEEHPVPDLRHPGSHSLHRLPVAGCDVDMVDAVTEHHLDDPVGFLLVEVTDRKRPEGDDGAPLFRTSEPALLHCDAALKGEWPSG